MARYELTDAEWKIIAPLLPNKSRGVKRVDDRRVLNGIFWRLRSGAPWAHIPERYARTRRATIGSYAGAPPVSGIIFCGLFRKPTPAKSK